jgi:probable HAF family extracellular repeat protein
MSKRVSFVTWRAISILCCGLSGILFHTHATAQDSVWVSKPYAITAPDGRVLHPRDLNDRGQVIGVDNSYLRSFLWSRQTGFKDLGDVAVYSINNCGEMAGSVGTDSNRLAVRIHNGLTEQLGTLEPDNPNAWSVGVGINERGDVVGTASRGEYEAVAFLWTEENGMVPLTGPPTDAVFFSATTDINNRRQIAGGKQYEPFNGLSVAAVWQETELQWTGGLGGRYFHAYAINAYGEIVGAGSTGNYYGPLQSSIYWSARTGLIELSPPGGPVDYWLEIGADAYDIDDRGRIAGAVNQSTEIYNWFLQAAVWTSPDRYHLLSDRPSIAIAINNRGQVLGSIHGDDTSPGMPAVLWQIHTPIDKSLLNAAYATLSDLAICRRRGL